MPRANIPLIYTVLHRPNITPNRIKIERNCFQFMRKKMRISWSILSFFSTTIWLNRKKRMQKSWNLHFHCDDIEIIVDKHHLNHSQMRLNKSYTNIVVYTECMCVCIVNFFCTHKIKFRLTLQFICMQKVFPYTWADCLLVARTLLLCYRFFSHRNIYLSYRWAYTEAR